MKNHILVGIFIQIIFILPVFSQTEAEVVNQRLDKTLELLKQRDQEINDLKVLVKKLEESKSTPCVIAINAFTEAYLKLPMPAADNSKQENKEIIKLRKNVHKVWLKTIQSPTHCDWKPDNSIWKELLKIAPIAAGILLK